MDSPDPEDTDWRHPHEHASSAGAPGASGPGEPSYEGEVTVGDEGAAAGPEAYQDPFGRPEPGEVDPPEQP